MEAEHEEQVCISRSLDMKVDKSWKKHVSTFMTTSYFTKLQKSSKQIRITLKRERRRDKYI